MTNVIYDDNRSARDVVLRTLLFKVFNKIETWELINVECGEITADTFDVSGVSDVLSQARLQGRKIYSNAYIMPPIRDVGGPKHLGHLRWLQTVLDDGLEQGVEEAESLDSIYSDLLSYSGIGPFLAFQFSIDLAYSAATHATEDDFVVPGPGSLDGIAKCFGRAQIRNASEIIKTVCDEQEYWFNKLGLDFHYLNGRRLRPIDCQNLFCEISKYARVAHPEVAGSAGRTKIKQVYRQHPMLLPSPFLPPKWSQL